jgi:ABC-2 type transport system permease protein
MMPSIRAEFRKLLTVRSTYIIIALCVLITIFFSFYLEGFRQAANVTSADKLASEVTSAAQALGLFIALAGLLLFTHEYRYSTIMYTLTAARSRTTVLLAKIIVVSIFAIILTTIVCAAAPYLTQLGIHAKGLTLSPQTFPFRDLLTRSIFYGWGYSMLALIITAIVRSQVGAIAILFLLPGLGESLLGLLLKQNAKYLPFNALGSILRDVPSAAINSGAALSHSSATMLVLSYIIGGWLIAWVLFLRRDAN